MFLQKIIITRICLWYKLQSTCQFVPDPMVFHFHRYMMNSDRDIYLEIYNKLIKKDLKEFEFSSERNHSLIKKEDFTYDIITTTLIPLFLISCTIVQLAPATSEKLLGNININGICHACMN